MKLVRAIDGEQRERVETLYLSAFPQNERKPYELMVKKQEEGFVDIFSLEEDNAFVGLAILVKKGDLVLLDYFAIDDKKRGGGYGSRALASIFSYYKGKRLILEIESTLKESENHKERIRRKAFYLRNGLTELSCSVLLFGVEMELLSNGQEVSFDEYQGIYAAAFGPRSFEFVRRLKGQKG
ncbi:MAG: GNAT family N-acetyltransferase [Lachnospiraceae bacterium]|nr:GNAT family N-acetyltransferase [Lachnospiraceae bacterium]